MSIYKIILTTFFFVVCFACKKSSFLDKKADESLLIPTHLKDFQALLDNSSYMNGDGIGLVPSIGEAFSDDYYLYPQTFTLLLTEPIFKSIYSWSDNIFNDNKLKPEDWGFPYRCIFYSNVVLEGLTKISPAINEQEQYNNLQGSALFYRAFMYFNLAQIFAPQYNPETARSDFGIPLKTSADINEKLTRATIEDTYKKIIEDLNLSLNLLANETSGQIINRPSKAAVYGLLTKVYLSMHEFDKALENANLYLNISDELLDFNILNPSNFYTIPKINNQEVIFYAILAKPRMEILNMAVARVDSNLYRSYSENDLRRTIFFEEASLFGLPGDKGHFYRGSYDGTDQFFAGIATDEIYLIRAECWARLGNVEKALHDLNTLLITRWDENIPYKNITASDTLEAINIILLERRKELIFRGCRWSDIRRLNSMGANIPNIRIIDGQQIELSPQSMKYTILIPPEVITFNPGMQQNSR
jgi:starch-binding outer membrane protein, SusD/RagB family